MDKEKESYLASPIVRATYQQLGGWAGVLVKLPRNLNFSPSHKFLVALPGATTGTGITMPDSYWCRMHVEGTEVIRKFLDCAKSDFGKRVTGTVAVWLKTNQNGRKSFVVDFERTKVKTTGILKIGAPAKGLPGEIKIPGSELVIRVEDLLPFTQ